jgi:hypothetical protein
VTEHSHRHLKCEKTDLKAQHVGEWSPLDDVDAEIGWMIGKAQFCSTWRMAGIVIIRVSIVSCHLVKGIGFTTVCFVGFLTYWPSGSSRDKLKWQCYSDSAQKSTKSRVHNTWTGDEFWFLQQYDER